MMQKKQKRKRPENNWCLLQTDFVFNLEVEYFAGLHTIKPESVVDLCVLHAL